MKIHSTFLALVTGLMAASPSSAFCPVENASRVQLQILGSGGPREASVGRASSSYLVWIDGVARILVDAGGGSKVPFHQAGANFSDIDLVALSHLHPDHSSELPALFWPPPRREIKISGPNAGGSFPSIEHFLESVFGESGAFPILSNRLNYDAIRIDTESEEATAVWSDGDIVVRGRRVPHGNVPAIGYRVDVGDFSIAFSSDQNGSDAGWTDFIQDVDVLVVHFGTEEDRDTAFHAKPSGWGRMAADAGAGQVVVSHITNQDALSAGVEFLQSTYSGQVVVAEDLLCVEVR
jgi:ribonuclease BN (tRNA processing enzyme)